MDTPKMLEFVVVVAFCRILPRVCGIYCGDDQPKVHSLKFSLSKLCC